MINETARPKPLPCLFWAQIEAGVARDRGGVFNQIGETTVRPVPKIGKSDVLGYRATLRLVVPGRKP
jgi:hypothetical protein